MKLGLNRGLGYAMVAMIATGGFMVYFYALYLHASEIAVDAYLGIFAPVSVLLIFHTWLEAMADAFVIKEGTT